MLRSQMYEFDAYLMNGDITLRNYVHWHLLVQAPLEMNKEKH